MIDREGMMDDLIASPTYLSAEAVLELEELKAGLRTDSPALSALFHSLRTPPPSPVFEGHEGASMLADIRSFSMLRDSLGEPRARKIHNLTELREAVEKFMNELEVGVRASSPTKIEEAKRFCLALGQNLISKQLWDMYQHKERSDSRYVSHVALSRREE